MKIKVNGKWSKHRPVRASTVGFRAEAIRLNGSDLNELAKLSDQDLCAHVRQLSARVNHVRRQKAELHPQKSIVESLGKFHSGGVVSNPTGRQPSWPETQFLKPERARSGRWPSDFPTKVLDESHRFKPVYSGRMARTDFSEIEKRVMAALGSDEKKARHASTASMVEVRARQHSKTVNEALEKFRREFRTMLDGALTAYVRAALENFQTQIDEEGCGAVFAALRTPE